MIANPSTDAELFDVLTAISIAGPDADNVLWVTFKVNDEHAILSVKAGTIAGDAVSRWRERQSAALANAVLARASDTDQT
jgi:hypothetical protein